MNRISIFLFLLPVLFSCGIQKKDADLSDISLNYQPNILWLSTEDIGCYIAAYGDSTVETPNIDKLAAEGVVFENAFTVAGQCAPSRFSIISGIYPASTGASNMRTWGQKLPDSIRYYPEYLMEAGYYCTNNSKTDYAFTEPKHETLWDETSPKAHYKKRPEDQPFFAIFNYTGTHESRFFDNQKELYVNPDEVPVPPYYADNDTIRKDLAINYSNIKRLDDWIGNKLRELEETGQADSTIVFFWSDHGGPLPNQKRELYDRGTKVPLIVKFPNNLFAGERVADMISLMDLGPTVMSLAGIPTPNYMHGQPFLGEYKAEPQQYVHAARDRIAAQYDVRRTTRDKRYRYIRNYYPELPRYQHFNYRMQIDMMLNLLENLESRKLNEIQQTWFEKTKPVEELYDTQTDPHEVNNLIADPEYTEVLTRLRNAHAEQMISTKDVGLIPEPMIFRLQDSLKIPIYSIVRKYDYPMKEFRKVAIEWTAEEPDVEMLADYLDHPHPVIRYWAVTGLGNLKSTTYKTEIAERLTDDFPSVQIAAAFTLHQLDETSKAVERLTAELDNEEITARILAAFQMARIGPPAKPATAKLKKLLEGQSYEQQAAENALRAIEK